ncbi:MAG: sugar phosphate isomerase/epimerase family protein, partial [Candidatus Hadarchaeales archaeon]
AAHARRRGVRIALENPGRDPRSYPGTFEELRRLAEAENLGITFDVGHANLFFRRMGVRSTAGQIVRYIRRMRDLIVHVHLHDNNGVNDDHFPPGKGEIDFPRVAAAFRRVGYNGAFILELWDPKNPLATGREGIRGARRVLS